MSEKLEDVNTLSDLMLNLPLFSCILREHLWLKKFTVSKPFLKKAIEDPKNFKDFSVLKSIRAEDSTSSSMESLNTSINLKSQDKSEPQLKLYKDFQWSVVPEYYWPIYSGDYSPMSPDGEFLERHGKIGVDFWNWNRETSPLGYVPPLCTCKRTEDCVKNLRKWSKNLRVDYDYTVCQNDVCRGLLYLPYSLLEIPLNRVISNGSEFALKVKVPDHTDLYCGNMKHTIILCTTSKKHEEECLEAIDLSDVSPPLIYDVSSKDFIPFFKKYNETNKESPLMSIEPIDSEVSDTENYGLGQLFAIKKINNNLLIEKFDLTTKTTSSIDDPLMDTWEKMCNLDKLNDCKEQKECIDGQKNDEESKKNNKNQIEEDTTDNRIDTEKMREILVKQEYQIYELIESFSSDRRPLSFTLRNGLDCESVEKRSYRGYDDYKETNKRKIIKVDEKTLESTHLLNILSKF